MEHIRYLRLTDYDNRGKIVRQVGFHFFVYENNSWKRIPSIPYFYPDAPEFECFEEITETEVRSVLGNGIDIYTLKSCTGGQLGDYFRDEDEYFEKCRKLTRPKDIDKIKNR